MRATDSQPPPDEPFPQLLADMVLWLALVLLFLAFRVTLFAIFRGELSHLPDGQSFVRCLNTGLRSDATAATWAILPSLTLTIAGFLHPLGILHRRVRQLTMVIVLILCGIIFVADVGYFAEYDNQFDHWIFGLIYDDRAAIWTTIWKSYHIPLLASFIIAGVIIGSWLLNRICRKAASGDAPDFLG